MADRGILYVAIGDQFLQEANQAAARAARTTDLPISIVTHRDVNPDFYDQVIVDENPTYSVSDKSRNLLKSPYEETLYMDSDTFMVEEVTGIFDCLQESSLAVTLDPHEGSLYSGNYNVDDAIPQSFPEFQTGVIVYRQHRETQEFIENWVNNHPGPDYPDQLSFRKTLYERDLDIDLFSARYNALMANVVNGPVKIIHDNNRNLSDVSQPELDRILSEINDYQGVRIPYNSYSKHLKLGPLARLSPYQLSLLLMRHGYRGLLIGAKYLVPSR